MRVRRLLAIVAVFFVTATALQIHGSSIAAWKTVLNDTSSPSGTLFSTPKVVRTDEWLAWTPSVLAQASHDPPFPVENANIGAGKTPLLVNLPVRHYSVFFRPQLYGFFVFDVETAYAFYWSVKVFGLLVSFFLLLRALIPGHFWLPLFGAGSVCFSAYTQWWFSCPPMLPEMLSCWAAAILCIIHLVRGPALGTRIFTATVLVIAGVNFTLCFYPPFQIPLAYVGAALLAGWFWQNRAAGLNWRAGAVSVGVAAIGIGGVLLPYLLECRPTLEIVASTQYPGARRSHGGDLAARDTFNGVLGFFNSSEENSLATRGNASESSNFYPLWLLVLGSGGYSLWRGRRERRAEIMLLAAVTVLTIYTFCPLPEWLCRWTLLNYVPGNRALLATGVGGIVFATMSLAKTIERSNNKRLRAFYALVAFSAVVTVLLACHPSTDPFLHPWRCGMLLSLNALFIGLYFFAPLKVFCGTFLLCLVLNNGAVNPVVTGLGPLLDSDAGVVVREIKRRDPAAKWMVYSSLRHAQFLKAQGAHVVNGLSYVPDLAFWRAFDPTGKFDAIYNRYAFSAFVLESGSHEFRLAPPVTYFPDVLPADRLLAERGVRYAAFPDQVAEPGAKGLRLVSNPSGARLWIYQVAAAP
ncbi:MAG: hypothetical protein WAO00_10615 [Chthoniobacterales bacterium]